MTSTKKGLTRYTCNGHIAKAPEGGDIKCRSNGWVVNSETSCDIECGSATASHSKITCKPLGWRPTHEVSCDGVSPGVIVGVLIGGLAAVVIIGIIYAKYKQRQKKKNNQSQQQQSGSRPGRKVVVGPEVASRPSSGSEGYDGPERGEQQKRPQVRGVASDAEGRGNWNATNNRNKSPAYNPAKIPSRESQAPPAVPPHGGGRRNRSVENPHPQYGGYGYHGDQEPSYPAYQSNPYPDAGYGYQATQPQVGYGGYPQPYPATRADYGRPYHVPT